MLFSIAIFILVLGVLVFVHELGHFLAAKACGIYVDRFSLGMPPRLFGKRIGETDYCIGLLPIGGYVKMAGQEDSPMSEEERENDYGNVPPERWFNKKPVWQRFIVIAAGPIMNLVLGIFLYGLVAAFGGNVPETKVEARVGFVLPDSPASQAPMYEMASAEGEMDFTRDPDAKGWQTGDHIVTIDGSVMDNISTVAVAAALGKGKVLDVRIERPTRDGGIAHYASQIEPELIEDGDHSQFGIAPFATAIVGRVLEGQPAAEQGFEPDDIIVRANGELIDQLTFVKMVSEMTEGETLTMEVARGEETLEIALAPATIGRFEGLGFDPPLYGAEGEHDEDVPTISYASPEVSEASGIKRQDVIEEINGEPATVALLRKVQRESAGKTVEFTIKRPPLLFGLVQSESTVTASLSPTAVGSIGVVFGDRQVFHRVPPGQVIPEAFRRGFGALSMTIDTLKSLVSGVLKPKDVGGPLLIAQMASSAARAGLRWLVEMTAFISVNLCVVNLLPLPVLDGGLLVLLLGEGIRRKPLGAKSEERLQKVGLVLILSLLLFVTFNDIMRWFTMTYF